MWWIIATLCMAPEPGYAKCQQEIWGPYRDAPECRQMLVAKRAYLDDGISRQVFLTMACKRGGGV